MVRGIHSIQKMRNDRAHLGVWCVVCVVYVQHRRNSRQNGPIIAYNSTKTTLEVSKRYPKSTKNRSDVLEAIWKRLGLKKTSDERTEVPNVIVLRKTGFWRFSKWA